MNLNEIEELVKIVRDAKVSELTVSIADSTVRLRKPLTAIASATKARTTTKADASKAAQPSVAPAEPTITEICISAPMVGIFHSINNMSTVDSPVKTGQVVGVIESMKLMNDVVADQDGVIEEVLIEDGMPVEYGQQLFRLKSG